MVCPMEEAVKQILLVVGCAIAITACVYSDGERADGDDAPTGALFGPGDNQEDACQLLEPGECRLSASCQQSGSCFGGAHCPHIEVTACLPLEAGLPYQPLRRCEELGSAACATRADCLSATNLGGDHVCLPEARTEDTHLTGDGRYILNVLDVAAVR